MDVQHSLAQTEVVDKDIRMRKKPAKVMEIEEEEEEEAIGNLEMDLVT